MRILRLAAASPAKEATVARVEKSIFACMRSDERKSRAASLSTKFSQMDGKKVEESYTFGKKLVYIVTSASYRGKIPIRGRLALSELIRGDHESAPKGARAFCFRLAGRT